jgi:uncharacterized protein YqgC (DUF456 family)
VDSSGTDVAVNVLAGAVIVGGLIGTVVPVLPGLWLSWLGVLGWAVFVDGGWVRWLIFGIVSVVVGLGLVVKYAWPGRNLKRTGVPTWSIMLGGLVGLVGFFVVPVVGLPLGFVLGVLLSELVRQSDLRRAWTATVAALKAVGLSMIVEICAGLAILAIWLIGVFVV